MSRLAAAGPPYRDVTEAFLLETMENWLMPYLQGITTAKDWREFNKLPALEAMFSYSEMEKLNRIAPASFVTPLGRKIPIFYHDDKPEISLKLQEMFGQKTHPPLLENLWRDCCPQQVDLANDNRYSRVWKTSYFDVRKDMRVDTQNILGQKIQGSLAKPSHQVENNYWNFHIISLGSLQEYSFSYRFE